MKKLKGLQRLSFPVRVGLQDRLGELPTKEQRQTKEHMKLRPTSEYWSRVNAEVLANKGKEHCFGEVMPVAEIWYFLEKILLAPKKSGIDP